MSVQRIEWTEHRRTGIVLEDFFIIAEKTDKDWEFFERSTWEIRWTKIPSTPLLRQRLLEEIRKRNNQKSLTR